jgi:alpha-L-fucosidase 2
MRKSIFILAIAGALSAAAVDRKDVEYTRPGEKPVFLDLHVPDGPGPFPAALLIHGGGFDEGSKSTNVRPLFDVLANAGYAWFSIDYRMAPEFRFPQAIEDVNSAINITMVADHLSVLDHPKVLVDSCSMTKHGGSQTACSRMR